MHALPNLENIEAYDAWRADAAQCLPAALDIARSHRLPHGEAHLFATGTNLVLALDDKLILKIFPPLLRHQFLSERMSLAQLRGRIAVPIPEIVLEANATAGPISLSPGSPASLASRRGLTCRRIKSSACSARSARPLRKCSACRLENCPPSNRAGMSSSPRRSNDATPGTHASASRQTSW